MANTNAGGGGSGSPSSPKATALSKVRHRRLKKLLAGMEKAASTYGNWNPRPMKILGKTTETLNRGLYHCPNLGSYEDHKEIEPVATVWNPDAVVQSVLEGKEPNLIGSLLYEEYNSIFTDTLTDDDQDRMFHAPVIDLDVRCRLVPTKNREHYHLYIDMPIRWREYAALLKALRDAHLIQPGFYEGSMKNGQSFVRWGHLKGDEDDDTD